MMKTGFALFLKNIGDRVGDNSRRDEQSRQHERIWVRIVLKPFKMNGKLYRLKIIVDSESVASVEGRCFLRKNEKPFRIARNGID